MGEFTISEVMTIVRPLCDSFVKEPTPEKAEEIAILVSRTPEALVRHLAILYPLVYHLKLDTFKSKDKNLKLIEAIKVVLFKTKLQNVTSFFEIYKNLCKQLCVKENSLELLKAHEELKEVVVLCMKNLVISCPISIIEQCYARQYAALISHGIYICIALANLEKSISLRLAALDAVMVLFQVHDDADLQDIVLRDQIADVVMLFLPGVVQGLIETAVGNETQNHKITMMAIRVLCRVVVLVMQDTNEENCLSNPFKIEDFMKSQNSKEFERLKNVLENRKRTPEWYTIVCEKFNNHFVKLDVLTKHENFNVRRELSTGVSSILLNCTRNVKLCFKILLEILITLSEDENELVSNETEIAIQKIQEKCLQDKEMKSTVEILEENFYDLLTKMPRIIRTSGVSLQLIWLNRLAGYFKILGKQRLSIILLSPAYLRKLLLTLINITELDCSNVSLLVDITITNFENTLHENETHKWKQFKCIFDSTSIEKLYNIFKCLGEFADYKTLVDSLLKMMLDLPKFRKELILILNGILAVPTDADIQRSVCKQVIEQYTASEFWNLPTKVSDEVTLQKAQQNIVQSCLLLEGLGVMADVLQENYQFFLLKTLYLIIEKAGSEYLLQRLVALHTLRIIAKSQKHEKIGLLFQDNVDYISFHVTLKLRRVDRNPGVLDVIEVVTAHSTMDFLTHLKGIVDDLLLQSSSNIQKRNAQAFLKVFYAFVKCVRNLTGKNDFKENDDFYEGLKNLNASEIVLKNFKDYCDAKKASCAYEDDKNVEDSENLQNSECEYDDSVIQEEEKEEKVPDSVIIVKDIMKRSLHFLPSQDFMESSLAMSVLREGSLVLKDYENELLPIVHEIWHPLVNRFQNSNPLVINHAWQLLCTLAQISRDFIRSRTLKQILPAILNYLKKSCQESYKKDSGSPYSFTQAYKLQRELLSQLGNFVKSLKLFEREIWNILTISEPYLDSLQNPVLQECSVNMYKEISDYSVDMVWIKCIDIWNRHIEPVKPENDLNEWYLKVKDCQTQSNYVENVQKILTFISVKSEML